MRGASQHVVELTPGILHFWNSHRSRAATTCSGCGKHCDSFNLQFVRFGREHRRKTRSDRRFTDCCSLSLPRIEQQVVSGGKGSVEVPAPAARSWWWRATSTSPLPACFTRERSGSNNPLNVFTSVCNGNPEVSISGVEVHTTGSILHPDKISGHRSELIFCSHNIKTNDTRVRGGNSHCCRCVLAAKQYFRSRHNFKFDLQEDGSADASFF